MSASQEAARAGTIPPAVLLVWGGDRLPLRLAIFCEGGTALGSSLHTAYGPTPARDYRVNFRTEHQSNGRKWKCLRLSPPPRG